jgi:dihydrodipicolinate synthase/N-acetylneuraminate lyase
LDLLSRIKDAHPVAFAGIKDSSGDRDFAIQLGNRFGQDLFVLTGNDRLFSLALEHHASGCITAMGNLYSPLLRQVWDAFENGSPLQSIQDKLSDARMILDKYPPMPPLLKGLLNQLYDLPLWPVRPPLLSFPHSSIQEVVASLNLLFS